MCLRLSQLGDKPFCLLQLVAAPLLSSTTALRIAIASFSFLSFSSFSSLVASFYTFSICSGVFLFSFVCYRFILSLFDRRSLPYTYMCL